MRRNGPPSRTVRPLRAQHADDTRRAILGAARHAFAQRGFADTPLDAIVQAAGLTKGALYHHFDSKAAVLEAVYVEMEQELAAEVQAAVLQRPGGPWDRMLAAVDAFFTASAEPAYTRIVLRDAPHVLGARHGRELDHAIGLGMVAELVSDLLRGSARRLPIIATARIVLAAASEVAVAMAYADDPALVRREGTAVLVALLDGLRAPPARAAARTARRPTPTATAKPTRRRAPSGLRPPSRPR
jgi:AcrR family transcriptional regulator